MERIESWPEEAQEELADIALEIEAEFRRGAYRANPKELAGIDRGLKAAREGRFAADQDVEDVSPNTGAHESHIDRRGSAGPRRDS